MIGQISHGCWSCLAEDLDQVRAVVARYSPEDSGDLESLIFIGQKERELPPDAAHLPDVAHPLDAE
jgi:hypothetical protein